MRVGVVALLLAVAGCRRSEPPLIGVVLGGEGMLAARLAMDSLRASPSDDLRRIGLRILRGRYNSDATVALAAAESLASDPAVVAVVGHSNSGASIAASQTYNAHRVVQVAPTTTSPLYSQAGAYSFRLVPSDEHQAAFLADEVVRAAPGRLAIMHVNDDYGRALRRLVVAELAAHGITPVYDGAYVERDSTVAAEMVQAITSARPDLLLWLGRGTHYGRISPVLRAALPTLSVLASDGFGGAITERDSLHLFHGVRYVRLVDVAGGSPALQALRRRYREAGGGELTDQAALTYDAILMLATAIREAGADRVAVRAWLAALGHERPPYPGVTGPIAFSPQRDRTARYVLVTAGQPAAGAP